MERQKPASEAASPVGDGELYIRKILVGESPTKRSGNFCFFDEGIEISTKSLLTTERARARAIFGGVRAR